MFNEVENKGGSLAYNYFDKLRGPDPNRSFDIELEGGSVHIRKYLPGEGVNTQDELLVVIDTITRGKISPGTFRAAFLYPDGKVAWRSRRDGRFINLSGAKAQIAGRVLVRCAGALAS